MEQLGAKPFEFHFDALETALFFLPELALRDRNARMLLAALFPHAGKDGLVRFPAPHCAGCDGSCAARGCRHGWYRAYVFIRQSRLANDWTRDRIVAELQGLGVPCMQGSCSEIYLEKAFEAGGSRPAARLPAARRLGETSIAFLVHPTIDEAAMARIAETAAAIFGQAAGKA